MKRILVVLMLAFMCIDYGSFMWCTDGDTGQSITIYKH